MKRQPNHKVEMPPSQVIDEEEREAAAGELFFEDDDAPPHRAGDELEEGGIAQSPQRMREAGLTEAALPDHGTTLDDAAPETLFDETDARSPWDEGDDIANDEELSIRDIREIGAGRGLDEAELGRVRPLDGRPWDGDPDDPL